MYDYVIVGAGSAGCVLANRLSEDPDVQVLLLEAGPPDTADFIHIPAAFSALFRSQNDWDLGTGYEPGPRGSPRLPAARQDARRLLVAQRDDLHPRQPGRLRRVVRRWAGAGTTCCPTSCAPRTTRAAPPSTTASAGRCACRTRWRAPASRRPSSTPRPRAACRPARTSTAARQDGIGWYQLTTRDGRRGSTAVSYLHPVMDRPNLTVETHVHAHRVLFDGTRAVGVVGSRLSELLEFRAEREVIVSAGAYLSPQILWLSGIGRPDELALLQVPTVAEVPGVGLGLQDHPAVGRDVDVRGAGEPQGRAHRGEPRAVGDRGRAARCRPTPPSAAASCARATTSTAPDVQFHMVSAMYVQEGLLPRAGARLHAVGLRAQAAEPRPGGGRLARPDDQAVHRPQLLRRARGHALGGGRPARGPRDRRHRAAGPVRADAHIAPASDSDADLEAHIRHTGQTIYHPTSTCRMGVDDLAVVDPELRVRGVEGLRVVDASIFPSVPRGNTNAPTIAVAEKASDLIRGRPAATVADAPARRRLTAGYAASSCFIPAASCASGSVEPAAPAPGANATRQPRAPPGATGDRLLGHEPATAAGARRR